MDERKATLDPIEDKGSSMGTEVNVLGVGNDNERDFATRIAESATHRKLGARQIQLTSIAGSIGAALFVAIGSGVPAGPLALLLGFTFWASVIYCIAQCQLEIVTKFPYDGSFIRLAGRMVDPAFGVAAGWNMFFQQTTYVMFEATIINTLIEYWGYDKNPAIMITVSLIFYLALNVYRADVFGEAEFWLALGKVIMAAGLILFTLAVMLGGNPIHDRFGFRYWKNPGPWAGENSSARLMSFVNAVNVAGFCMAGPDYISMIAGEATNPRRTLPKAFKTIMMRLIIFYIGGALCVGILVPSNDSTLLNGADTYSGASPYVIAMTRLKIPVLPSVITAGLLTTIISGGNAYTYNASRSLHALALDHKAPGFLRKTNKHGNPYICVIVVMILSCLSFLALGSGSAKVLDWILSFCTASAMANWTAISITYLRFHKAMKVQGVDKNSYLPQVSRWQPYAVYWAAFWSPLFMLVQGYSVFLKGNWQVSTFIFSYGIIALAGVIGLAFKIIQRTPFHRAMDIDLQTDVEFFEELDIYYQQKRDEEGPGNLRQRIIAKMF